MSVFCFGEILLRLSPPDGLRFTQAHHFEAVYGGSEANVAVSLAQLGVATSFVSRVPDNDLGRAALGAVARFGVETRYTVFGGDRLGIYFLENGAGRRSSAVLYDRAHSGMATLEPGQIHWQKTLENAEWLHWSGITPALSASAAAATLAALTIAREKNIKVSCDLNYRAKLWQYGTSPVEIMPPLIELCDVILGDTDVFERYFGIRDEAPEALLQRVAERFPRLQYIAMTNREGISASHNTYRGVLYDRNQTYASRTYELPDMLDRIGGGDAFMAGLIFGLRNMPTQPQEVVEFATAAAAFKHYVRGDFNLCSESEVRALMAGHSGGRVNR